MEEKKIIEWLNLIEDSEIRTNAIENCIRGDNVVGNIKEALWLAFAWKSTPQGYGYWADILQSKIQLLKEPAN